MAVTIGRITGQVGLSAWALAVDFGTTATAAAVCRSDGRVSGVVFADGAATMPSSVFADPAGLLVGARADSSAGYALDCYEPTPKRQVGRPRVLLGEQEFRPAELIAAVYADVIGEAVRQHDDTPPARLVLTHPVGWSANRLGVLAEAAGLSGAQLGIVLPDPEFVPEPVAAAVHYSHSHPGDPDSAVGACFAVYDLGGGTFDATVLRRTATGFEVLASGGVDPLGGFDFDNRLFGYLGSTHIAPADPTLWQALSSPDPGDPDSEQRCRTLQTNVRQLKEDLSVVTQRTIRLPGVKQPVMVTRDELEHLIRPELQATLTALQATIGRAGLTPDQLAAVYRIGGASRTPLVGNLLNQLRRPIRTVDHPKTVVAQGAITPAPTIPQAGDAGRPHPPAAKAAARVREGGNLLADSQWADALSAFFAERWAEAVERFEKLQASYPGEARVETRLKEARRQRDINVLVSRADASAAESDWDTAVAALESLTALDPAHPDVGARLERARLGQRRKTLVDEMTALHQAGQWNAVVAAARELARIDPDNSDPNGIVSDAQNKIRVHALADRYAQALNHLDQEQWQQAADLLTAIEREQRGYRDAAALLKTAQQKLRETTDVTQPPTPLPWRQPQTTTPAPVRTTTGPVPIAVQKRSQTGWFVAAASIAVIGVTLAIVVVVRSSKPSDTSASIATLTSTSMSTATTTFPPLGASGPNETITDYLKKNNIQETPITPGTPGAPTIDLPVPEGWRPITEGPDAAQYFGIVFNTPANPADPPKIIGTLEKLTGNVDTDKLLAVAPGEVKNLPGYTGSDGQRGTLSGQPTSKLGGSYTKNGVTRMVAQNTVVIQSPDGVYLLQLKPEGPEADADALKAATGVIVQKTKITP